MEDLMKIKPTRKITAAATGGIGLGPLIVWILQLLGVDITPEVAASIAGLAALVLGWLVPEKK